MQVFKPYIKNITVGRGAFIQNAMQLTEVLDWLTPKDKFAVLMNEGNDITFGQNGVIKNGIQLTEVFDCLNYNQKITFLNTYRDKIDNAKDSFSGTYIHWISKVKLEQIYDKIKKKVEENDFDVGFTLRKKEIKYFKSLTKHQAKVPETVKKIWDLITDNNGDFRDDIDFYETLNKIDKLGLSKKSSNRFCANFLSDRKEPTKAFYKELAKVSSQSDESLTYD